LYFIVRLLASSLIKDKKTQKEKVLYLDSIGFTPTEIARLLSTTSNTVNVTLSRSRKDSKESQENELNTESRGV